MGEGVSAEAAGRSQSAGGGSKAESDSRVGNATAVSKGTIGTGAGEAELTQASGGSVD